MGADVYDIEFKGRQRIGSLIVMGIHYVGHKLLDWDLYPSV